MKPSPSRLHSARKLVRDICFLHDRQDRIRASRGSTAPLDGQPFDRLLLKQSPFFARSRKDFLSRGGTFRSGLLSSGRSLSSSALISLDISYTPHEAEILWSATDLVERRTRPERLLELRTWSTSLFHEQNHRILWTFLPPAPSESDALRRYLNWSESAVVALDMALSDHLDPEMARALYEVGVVYDPGSEARRDSNSKRVYRNYLQAAAYATYLNLELYDPAQIPHLIERLYPHSLFAKNPRFRSRAAERALNLDRQFVEVTNPIWQRKHLKELPRLFRQIQDVEKMPLVLTDNPLDNLQHTLWLEKVLDHFGF